jgi:hypothetical protein
MTLMRPGEYRISRRDLSELARELFGLDAEAVGGFVREALSIGLEEQLKWRDDSSALRGWTRAVEDLGVLVLHTSTVRGQTVSPDEMLGFSEPDPVAVIVLKREGSRTPPDLHASP